MNFITVYGITINADKICAITYAFSDKKRWSDKPTGDDVIYYQKELVEIILKMGDSHNPIDIRLPISKEVITSAKGSEYKKPSKDTLLNHTYELMAYLDNNLQNETDVAAKDLIKEVTQEIEKQLALKVAA